jgi:TRAP-type C4-dicarboxylate transport system permease small subunit
LLDRLLVTVEHLAAIVLAVDVLVGVLLGHLALLLHQPFDWAEEIARALMGALVFLGAATALGRAQHVGVESLRRFFPVRWRPAVIQLCHWIVVAVSASLLASAIALLGDVQGQMTPIGLPQSIYVWPLVAAACS